MTKWLLLLATVMIIIVGTVVGVSSCSRTSQFQLALDNLSEARLFMKHAELEGFNAQFFAGMREDPYIVNGISERKVPFGIINLEARETIEADEIEGSLKIGEELLSITLDRNPHGANFGTDIEFLPPVEKDLILTLTIGETTHVFNFTNVMPPDAISWERALEIAVDHLAPQIRRAGKFECYVKIITCPVKSGCSYWYVRFVPEKGENFFVVIDATGRIVNNQRAQK